MAQFDYGDIADPRNPPPLQAQNPNWNTTLPRDQWNAARMQVINALNDAYLKSGTTSAVPYGSPPDDNEAWAAGRRADMAKYVSTLAKPSTFAGSGAGTFTGSSGKTIVPRAGSENINFWKNNPSGATPAAVEQYKQKLLPSNWLYKQEMGEIPIQGPLREGEAQQTKMGLRTVPSTWQDLMANKEIVTDAVGPEGYAGLVTSGQTMENNQKLMNALVQAKAAETTAEKLIPIITQQNPKPLNALDQFNLNEKTRASSGKESVVDALINLRTPDFPNGIRTVADFDKYINQEVKNEQSGVPSNSLFATVKTIGQQYPETWRADILGRILMKAQQGGGVQQGMTESQPGIVDMMATTTPDYAANFIPQTQSQTLKPLNFTQKSLDTFLAKSPAAKAETIKTLKEQGYDTSSLEVK